MKSLNVVLVLVGLVFVGCGGGGSDSTAPQTNIPPKTEAVDIVDTTANYHIAQDNSIHDVNVTFGTFKVVVYTDSLIDTTSQSTKAIYGNINKKPTNSLVSVNSNYVDGTAFIVKVFSGSTLVGESQKAILSGGTLEFSDIRTK